MPDGYLALGTEFGLFRFDGVRVTPWQPPDGEPLPDPWVRSLLATRDGALWVGTLRGLVSFKDRRRTSYPELAGRAINDLLEDRDGTVYLTAQSATGGRGWICAIRDSRAQCAGEGDLGTYVGQLYEDSRRTHLGGVGDRTLALDAGARDTILAVVRRG